MWPSATAARTAVSSRTVSRRFANQYGAVSSSASPTAAPVTVEYIGTVPGSGSNPDSACSRSVRSTSIRLECEA